MSDDNDKTVFGGKLPTPPATPKRTAPDAADRTVIGGALPPARPAASPAPQAPPAAPAPPSGNTWLGGAVPQTPVTPMPGQQPSPFPQANIGQPTTNTNAQGFFPGVQQPQQAPAAPAGPQIGLQQALRATGLGAGGPTNPLLAAAANLLILFGRLRTGMVEMQAQPLMDHVVREIEVFETNAVNGGADPLEAQVGKYALCGTADDIVQNLPGADRGQWIQYSMVARFFQMRDSGVGFFQEAEKAMQAPGQRYRLLELMLVCLSLGFEGQYRTAPNGAMELARIRAAIYETLRRVQPRPDEDISVNWAAVPMTGRRRYGAVPMWIIGAAAAAFVVASFAGLSTYINRQGSAVETVLNTMHPNVAKISLSRAGIATAFVPEVDNSQIDRIRATLGPEIADGSIVIGEKGQFIFVRVGNALLFDSGSADVKPGFAPLGQRIADMLNTEPGPVIVQGFTDGVPASGRGRYKTNLELSVARAEGVKAVLEGMLTDPTRLTVEGRGEADPIGDNATREGQALNRRVEVLIAREGTLDQ